ncbi:hypothetical protein BDY19DRAFT_998936 [Irpex rosettiformis]|uniref:Uncharacterized protein n=1 Tax=Irpex rosettiformis TaxID=378272 RepID=A0ACB8TLY2_9APHY|nr:hypothetical protein BDY19DRAFT_998936 [Irpex rosettiformis]
MSFTTSALADALPALHHSLSGPALYAPPALRRYTQLQGITNPTEISLERHRQRLNIRKFNDDPAPHQLHRHFITEANDRRLAAAEAIGDIRDALTGMDHVADVLFVGFVIRPEWDLSHPLDPANINVEVITSHHVKQHLEYQRTVDGLRKAIQREIAFPHIYTYHKRLRAVTPGFGYAVDAETGRLQDNEIQLGEGVRAPPVVDPRSGNVLTTLRTTVPTSGSSSHQECSPQAERTVVDVNTPREARIQPSEHAIAQAASREPVRVQTSRGFRWIRPSRPQPSMLPTPSSASAVPPVASSITSLETLERTYHGIQPSGSSTSPLPFRTTSAQLTSQERTQRREPPPTATPVLMTQPQQPIVVSDSESDGSASLTDDASSASDEEEEESDVESWVHTPEGSPPRRLSHRSQAVPRSTLPSVQNITSPEDPPPEYSTYLQPTIESFGFHPHIAQFLASRHLSPAGLVRVDSTLNFHLNDWSVGFLEAGLSESDAQELQLVVLHSLPDLTRDALIAAWVAEDN